MWIEHQFADKSFNRDSKRSRSVAGRLTSIGTVALAGNNA